VENFGNRTTISSILANFLLQLHVRRKSHNCTSEMFTEWHNLTPGWKGASLRLTAFTQSCLLSLMSRVRLCYPVKIS